MIWLPMFIFRRFSMTFSEIFCALASCSFQAGTLVSLAEAFFLPAPGFCLSFFAWATILSRSRSRRSTFENAAMPCRVSAASFSSVNSSSLTSTISFTAMSPLRSASRSSWKRSSARFVERMARVTWFLPSSMRLASAISPSRVRSETRPISRR
jgi:hypothetical protein